MKFVFNDESGKEVLTIDGEQFKYIFKVRRHSKNETIFLRNSLTFVLYSYKIIDVSKKEAKVELIEEIKEIKEQKDQKEVQKKFHLGWCIIDPKEIENSLASLNEIGISKISFIYCDRSQKNFKINLDRLKRVLLASSQQCGRADIIEIQVLNSIEEFFESEPKSVILDFSKDNFSCSETIESCLVGCEGGFSSGEKELFKNRRVLGFKTSNILRSKTAVISLASKILL